MEMDYWRRSAKLLRMDRIQNDKIIIRMDGEETIIERVEKREFKWYRHIMRIEEDNG
jgi:hypothetical protein